MFLVTTLLVPHTIPRNSLVTSLESLEDPSFIARLGRDHCTTKDSDQCLHMLRVAPLRLRQHHLQHEAGAHISLFPSLLSPCWSFWSLGCSHYFCVCFFSESPYASTSGLSSKAASVAVRLVLASTWRGRSMGRRAPAHIPLAPVWRRWLPFGWVNWDPICLWVRHSKPWHPRPLGTRYPMVP